MFMGLNQKKIYNHTKINTNTEVQVYFTAKMDTCVCFGYLHRSQPLRLEMSSVCVLRPVFAFCVLRHVRRKKNVRRHGKHGIY